MGAMRNGIALLLLTLVGAGTIWYIGRPVSFDASPVWCAARATPAHLMLPCPRSIVADESKHAVWLIERLNNITRAARAAGCPSRAVVFACDDESGGCGGRGDRIKGLVSAFAYALMTNAQFVVHWTRPLSVEEYYEFPKTFTVSASSHVDAYEALKRRGKTFQMSGIVGWQRVPDQVVHDVDTSLIRVVHNGATWPILLNNNLTLASMYGLKDLKWTQTFRVLVSAFFARPTRLLQRLVAKVKKNFPPLPWVGIHLRTGLDRGIGLDGKMDRFMMARISPEATPCMVRKALELCGKLRGGRCNFFLESDSAKSRALLLSQLGVQSELSKVTFINSTLAHSDKFEEKLDDMHGVFDGMFAGWEMLKEMDALVISRSGFSESAAWIGHCPTISFYPSHVQGKPCRWRRYPTDENAFSEFGHPETTCVTEAAKK